ncbi:hypothetical protein [Nocardiopsis eucommiae]|uniref:hypothetical protein n=1 Tax=Nocardiopsis eucommiae TaxID=2831970 RepID=UPI003D72256D
MNLRDAIVDALYTVPADPSEASERVARRAAGHDADAVMPALHAYLHRLERAIRESARLADDDERALGMMDAADMIKQARTS